MAGLFDPPSIFLGVIDGAIMIQLTGFPIFVRRPFEYFSSGREKRKEKSRKVEMKT
jgi:hypothetical protein